MFGSLKEMFGIREPIKPQTIVVSLAVVTFMTGKKSRQNMLKKIDRGEPPYDEEYEVTLKDYLYEGKRAIGVYVNKDQIGSIKSEDMAKLESYRTSSMEVKEFNVCGGYDGKNYGAKIKISIK